MKTVESFDVSEDEGSVQCSRKNGNTYDCVVESWESGVKKGKGVIKGASDILFNGFGTSITFKEDGIDHVVVSPLQKQMTCSLRDNPFGKFLFCSNIPDLSNVPFMPDA